MERTASSWLDGLDRTLDFASDKLGRVLLGGIKTIESTVGVAIEPISSPSATPPPPSDDVEGEEEKEGSPRGGDKGDLSTRTGGDAPTSKTISPVGEGWIESPSSSTREQVEALSKNIYEVGLSTLGKLGRTTASIVVRAKDRLAPMLDAEGVVGPRERIDRQELKKPFKLLLEEFSGLEAMESLQLAGTQASIKLKADLKALNPQKLAAKQAELKGIGRELLTMDNNEREEGSGDVKDAWLQISLEDTFAREQLDFAQKLVGATIECLRTFGGIDSLQAALAELSARVEAPLPVDTPTLAIYLARYNLAKLLAAGLFLLQILAFPAVTEEQVVGVAERIQASLRQLGQYLGENLVVEDEKRKAAVCSVLAQDLEEAQSLLRDIVPTLQPRLKLAKLGGGRHQQ